MSKLVVAAAQPHSFRGDEEKRNLETALTYIKDAAAKGANIVLFPEGFPGPYNGPTDWSAEEAICKQSKDSNLYTVFGLVEQSEKFADKFRLTLKVASPEGRVVGSYHRLQPNRKDVDWVLMKKSIIPGESFLVIDTEYGRLGFLICSELWCPELPRVLALMGVDVLFAPIGGLVYELTDAWRCLLWARAIENHMYVVTTQNVYGMEEGMATITGPEKRLGELREPGVLVAELDIDRLKWLRSNDQKLDLPKQYKSIPGLLRYRRPELYGELLKQREGTYKFHD